MLLHAALVGVVVLLLAALDLASHDVTDANIGGGFFILMLAVLGLPWSIYILQASWMGHWPIWQQDAAWTLPAVLNVVLHLIVVLAINRYQVHRAGRH